MKNQPHIDTTGFGERINRAASEIGLDLSEKQNTALIQYVELLARWNSTYNLTAVRDPSEMLDRHIIDSLSVVPFVDAATVMDVGTGPGLPGIPLAVMYPEKFFVLLDSNIKKTRFLTQASITLGLSNVEVIHERIENLIGKREFPLIISRAFTAAHNFARLCGPCLAKDGKLLAMKGSEAENEAAELPDGYRSKEIIKLSVPGCEAQRHLIIIEKTA